MGIEGHQGASRGIKRHQEAPVNCKFAIVNLQFEIASRLTSAPGGAQTVRHLPVQRQPFQHSIHQPAFTVHRHAGKS